MFSLSVVLVTIVNRSAQKTSGWKLLHCRSHHSNVYGTWSTQFADPYEVRGEHISHHQLLSSCGRFTWAHSHYQKSYYIDYTLRRLHTALFPGSHVPEREHRMSTCVWYLIYVVCWPIWGEHFLAEKVRFHSNSVAIIQQLHTALSKAMTEPFHVTDLTWHQSIFVLWVCSRYSCEEEHTLHCSKLAFN